MHDPNKAIEGIKAEAKEVKEEVKEVKEDVKDKVEKS